jgi:hypothetical protein
MPHGACLPNDKCGVGRTSWPPSRRLSSKAMHHLRLTFDQLALIHKSLQAVRTLAVLPPRDELLDDTIDLVDQALDHAVRAGALRAK